jgi:hypothetical protein
MSFFWCLIEFIQLVMMVFRPRFLKYIAPLTFLSGSTPTPLPPIPKVKVQYIQTVCGWEGTGGEVLSCVGDYILQEFNTQFLTRFRTYKFATPPQTKT